MKWILFLSLVAPATLPVLFLAQPSYAQDDFSDFDEDFSDTESESGEDDDFAGFDEESSDDDASEEAAEDIASSDDVEDLDGEENSDDLEELDDESLSEDSTEEVADSDDDFLNEDEDEDVAVEEEEFSEEAVATEELILDEGGADEIVEDVVEPEKSQDLFLEAADDESIIGEVQDDSGPDLQYEADLYDIYIKFHSTPLPDKEWDYIAGSKISEAYTIEKGDSLWGMSKTFFGDGNYWPKIWSVNSRITNPHLIEPKNVIRFILGSENEAPMFAVTEEKPIDEEIAELEEVDESLEDTQLEDLAKDIGDLEKELEEEFSEAQLEEELLSDEELEGVVIPPPEAIIRPVTQVYPPSLPQWKTYAESILESRELSLQPPAKNDKKSKLPLTYYIDEDQPEGVGKIVGVEGGGTLTAKYQYVYVRIKKGYAKIGDTFLITKNTGPLKMSSGVQEDAIIWEVQGKVSIKSRLTATKKYKSKSYDVFRAYVDSSINVVTVGAELRNEDYLFLELNKKGRIPAVSGVIIGGEFDNKRNLLTRESLAYLSVGANEGVEAGDILPIYSNHYLEQVDPYVLTTNRPMGLIKIAKVSGYYSTGYVVENNGSISIGDFVGVKEGFEKEYLGEKRYKKEKKKVLDKELEELQAMLNAEEDTDIDESEAESFEYMDDGGY